MSQGKIVRFSVGAPSYSRGRNMRVGAPNNCSVETTETSGF